MKNEQKKAKKNLQGINLPSKFFQNPSNKKKKKKTTPAPIPPLFIFPPNFPPKKKIYIY